MKNKRIKNIILGFIILLCMFFLKNRINKIIFLVSLVIGMTIFELIIYKKNIKRIDIILEKYDSLKRVICDKIIHVSNKKNIRTKDFYEIYGEIKSKKKFLNKFKIDTNKNKFFTQFLKIILKKYTIGVYFNYNKEYQNYLELDKKLQTILLDLRLFNSKTPS